MPDMSEVHVDSATWQKAEYEGREVDLDKPFRTPGAAKKFAVYVRDGDRVKIVRFGDPDMEIRRDDPDARRNFRARHNCDTAKDKTSARYWSCRMWSDSAVSDIAKKDEEWGFTIDFSVHKMDTENQVVYGWFSVISKDGQPVVDKQGDYIPPEELVKAAHAFLSNSRMAKAMHEGGQKGFLVESMVFTGDLQKALGIDLKQEGWFGGFKITDNDLWSEVKKGNFPMFSIGGKGKRVESTEGHGD